MFDLMAVRRNFLLFSFLFQIEKSTKFDVTHLYHEDEPVLVELFFRGNEEIQQKTRKHRCEVIYRMKMDVLLSRARARKKAHSAGLFQSSPRHAEQQTPKENNDDDVENEDSVPNTNEKKNERDEDDHLLHFEQKKE